MGSLLPLDDTCTSRSHSRGVIPFLPCPRLRTSSRRRRIAARLAISLGVLLLAGGGAGCGGQGSSRGVPPLPTATESRCQPSWQHPYPVVLLPGTYGDTSWQLIEPHLARLGYCVYTFSYGNSETGAIATSARQLAGFVNQLLATTGARRVSLVGHSEGGMMPRYYIEYLGGAAKVAKLIALAPSNHGTVNPSTIGGAMAGCVACAQQEVGPAFLANLNAGDEAPPPVSYTVIETLYDSVVVPYTSRFSKPLRRA